MLLIEPYFSISTCLLREGKEKAVFLQYSVRSRRAFGDKSQFDAQ